MEGCANEYALVFHNTELNWAEFSKFTYFFISLEKNISELAVEVIVEVSYRFKTKPIIIFSSF
jgi:hypothetical protein